MIDNCGFKNLGTWVVCITLQVQVFRPELRLLQTLIDHKGSYLREQMSADRKRVSIDMSSLWQWRLRAYTGMREGTWFYKDTDVLVLLDECIEREGSQKR